MNNVKIYVTTHKRYDNILKIPYDYYIPIHCGKEIYDFDKEIIIDGVKQSYLPELGDNTGDNISYKNQYYCELTGMYWIWKNDNSSPDDIIGLNHYRRYFSEDIDDTKFISKETIISLLNEYDFLVNGVSTDVDYTESNNEFIYDQYKSCHIIQDLDYAIEGVKILFPNMYDIIYNQLMYNAAACFCNMFITKKSLFDKYCEFLFSTLAYVESKITDIDSRDEYNKRVFGFLGERLFRPYLKANNYKTRSLNKIYWQ